MLRAIAVCLLALVAASVAAQDVGERPDVRFEAVDVAVDSGRTPLAAYQFEFTAPADRVTLVGVEGGESAAFAAAPYYDPAALMHDRVIVAAFSTGRDLPTGRTRVARLHLMITGEGEPDYGLKLQAAAGPDGHEIPATASLAHGEQP